MANWCVTKCVIDGEPGSVAEVYALFQRLAEERKEYEVIGLNYIAEAIGLDPEKVYCRGHIDSKTLWADGERIVFTMWSKWTPAYEVFYALSRWKPELKGYYYAEETLNCLFETNDTQGIYFLDRYVVFLETEDWDPLYGKFTTLEDAVEWVSKNEHSGCARPEDILLHFQTSAPCRPFESEGCWVYEVEIKDESTELTFYRNGDNDDSLDGRLVDGNGNTVANVKINLNIE